MYHNLQHSGDGFARDSIYTKANGIVNNIQILF